MLQDSSSFLGRQVGYGSLRAMLQKRALSADWRKHTAAVRRCEKKW